MNAHKKNMKNSVSTTENKRKRRMVKFLIWVGIDVGILILLLVLLLWKPGGFQSRPGINSDQVSTYLTHKLAPSVYNGLGSGKAFEIVLDEDGINDIIARMDWPRAEGEVVLRTPEVTFADGQIKIMATAVIEGVEIVVTLDSRPHLNENGLFDPGLNGIYVGKMNVTPLARMMAKKAYEENLAPYIDKKQTVDLSDWVALIARSVFKGEPVEPIINFENKSARITGIRLDKDKVIINFEPVS